MKVLIYGAGGLGSLYAARLQRAGQDVTLLARGRRLDDLREHGVVLENGLTGERSVTRVPLVDCLYPEDSYDFVLVMMGRQQVPAVLPALTANRKVPAFVFLGNNAAGADEYVRAVGRGRVILGFPGASAYRTGNIVRYVGEKSGQAGKTYAGELDGRVSARLGCLANIFERTGLPLQYVSNMDAWLKTHAALILPIACAVFSAGMDLQRLARTRDAQVLAVRAIRENLSGLKSAGIPLEPGEMRLLAWLPEPLLVSLVGKAVAGRRAEITFGHAADTRSEMCLLADQLDRITRRAGEEALASDFLKQWLNPLEAPLNDGSAHLDMSWREAAIPLAGLASLAFVSRLIHRD